MNPTLLSNVAIDRILVDTAAGQAATASTILDMANWEGVIFIAKLGDVADTSVVTLNAQQNTINSSSGMASLAGSATFTAGATSADDNLLVLDVFRPRERYVRALFTSATANAVKNGIIAIRYGPRKQPVTQGATVLASATLIEAAEA
jgi:hypothetical protein